MKVVNLLEFIHSANSLKTLDFVKCDSDLVNFLDLLSEDEQFTYKISLGLIYVNQKVSDKYILIDGVSRILSVSLLLHAICECYKKTTPKNENAIKTIRSKYLYKGNATRLQLPPKQQEVYEKILSQARLSGKEKETPIFKLLHAFWTQIKAEKLQASSIFKMLDKVVVTIVDSGNVPLRDLYYELNKNNYDINQLLLIKDYMSEISCYNYWNEFKDVFSGNIDDINDFFKIFFVSKFSFKEYSEKRLYETYVNYVVTMSKYTAVGELFKKLINSAKLYYDILNVNFKNEIIKQELIKIKLNNGEDTYSYLLNISQDYYDKTITEATFIEILQTINEYLEKRNKMPTDVPFNDLVNYLNVFVTCK